MLSLCFKFRCNDKPMLDAGRWMLEVIGRATVPAAMPRKFVGRATVPAATPRKFVGRATVPAATPGALKPARHAAQAPPLRVTGPTMSSTNSQ
jgi:hypothetical protein